MAQVTHLSNAPITEAIIQIRCNLAGEFDVESFAQCHSDFPDEFNQGEPISEGSVKIEFRAGRPTKLDQFVDESAGYKFVSADKSKTVFFRKGSFTFSRAAPYDNWSEFSSTARALWESYRSCVGSYQVTRISTRFINRLDLPLPLDFDEYLVAGPKVPEGLPQGVAHYLTRLHIPVPEAESLILLSQTMGTQRDQLHVPVILDVDVLRECEPAPLPDEGIWEILDTLRKLKNDTFFASVTEKLVELYR